MGKHYTNEFKTQVLKDYKSGEYGGREQVARKYNLSSSTIWHWIEKDRKQGNQTNDINHSRGNSRKKDIDYKERYEILKKYQAFMKARREKR